jgi:hypothetical protein
MPGKPLPTPRLFAASLARALRSELRQLPVRFAWREGDEVEEVEDPPVSLTPPPCNPPAHDVRQLPPGKPDRVALAAPPAPPFGRTNETGWRDGVAAVMIGWSAACGEK